MFNSPLQLSIDSQKVLNLLLNSDQNNKKKVIKYIFSFQNKEMKKGTVQAK